MNLTSAKLTSIIIFILALNLEAFSQKIFTNYDIKQFEALNDSQDFVKVKETWIKFLSCRDDSLGGQYWNEEEIKKYGNTSYFLIENEMDFGMDNYLDFLKYCRIKILEINNLGDFYKVKSLIEWKEKEDISNIQYIFDVYLKKVDGEFKIFNAEGVNKKFFLKNKKIGNITYYFKKDFEFDVQIAENQQLMLEGIAKEYNVEYPEIDALVGNSLEEVNILKGIHYKIGCSNIKFPKRKNGYSSPSTKTVYISNLYYPHEFLHILFNPLFPKVHPWVIEGFCTYYGGTGGQSDLNWHVSRLSSILEENKDIDFTNFLNLKAFDDITSYRYVLGGFIIKMIHNKGGNDLVYKFLKNVTTDQEYYSFLEEELDIKQKDFNTILKKAILNYNVAN